MSYKHFAPDLKELSSIQNVLSKYNNDDSWTFDIVFIPSILFFFSKSGIKHKFENLKIFL